MNSDAVRRSEEIVRITKTAVQAVEQGRWDVVIQCYQDRGTLFEEGPTSISAPHELLALDALVRERAQTAQVLLQSLLEGAGVARVQLQGLRQKLAAVASVPERMSVEA